MIPAGLCQCGCGEATQPARQTDRSRGIVKGEPRRFLPGHNRRVDRMCGPKNPRWNGGRRRDSAGYVYRLQPDHPNASAIGYVGEHVLFASRALGKALPSGAIVHHVDGNPARNVNRNLVVCDDQAYHMLLEQRTRAYNASGHANWRLCADCGRYDDPGRLRKRGGSLYHGGECPAVSEVAAA